MTSKILRAGVLAFFAMSVTACGGGGSGGSLPYQPASNLSVMTSTTGSTTLPSLIAADFTVTGSLGRATAAAQVGEALSTSPPLGVTPLSVRRVASHIQGAVVGTATDMLYVTFTSSTAVTFVASPVLTFTSAEIQSGTVYNLALFSNGAWTAPFQAGQIGGSGVVTFPSTSTSFSILPNAPATFVLYTGDATTTAIVLLPGTLAFVSGNPSSGSFSASEVQYSGALNATMTCTESPTGQTPASNAFVAEFTGTGMTSSQTPSAAGGSVTFNVSSGAETGTCTVAVSDTNGNTSTATIYVSNSSLTVTGKERN